MRSKMVCIVAALVMVTSACGGSDESEAGSEDGDRQAVIDWMLGQGETQESAECFADELSGYTAEDFENLDTIETTEDLPEGMAEDVMAAVATCVTE
jgi:ABC-type phosphate/phosphonate transport system substrate-binding protein